MPKRKGSVLSSRSGGTALHKPEPASSYVPMCTQHHVPKKLPPVRQIFIAAVSIVVILVVVLLVFVFRVGVAQPKQPDELLQDYYAMIERGDYGSLYALITEDARASITYDDFIKRNENIYSGIETGEITVDVREVSGIDVYGNPSQSESTKDKVVSYSLEMATVAGSVSFDGEAVYRGVGDGEYRLAWTPGMIYPDLAWTDRVQVNTVPAVRGRILDRYGRVLAGQGVAPTAGFVPKAMNRNGEAGGETDGVQTAPYNPDDIAKAAKLLGMSAGTIMQNLKASYVKEDTFVLLKTLSQDESALIDELLTIPGIMIGETSVRQYPLAEKASHLTGYIQSIGAEELEAVRDKGYGEHSVIGKAGFEKLYEDRLRAVDGHEIIIVDKNGAVKKSLAKNDAADGQDITLTIDIDTQMRLYDVFAEDKSCSVALHPKTGEVLALVSTPTYDANDFVIGLSDDTWKILNEDPDLPFYNRFTAALSPGSTMKPITAAIGLETGALSSADDLGRSGLAWQKDASWGDYRVTTTMEYDGPANLENALKFSDNIFFAKMALEIGADRFARELIRIGFEEEIPFEFGLYSSILSSNSGFDSEIQLADSGYGQGQILINPVHMATLYASFVNQGSILQPHLILQESSSPTYWKEAAFSPETAQTIRDDLVAVIESGSSTDAMVAGRTLGGKTGTAEIKASADDTSGTELGWFIAFTANDDDPDPLLVVSMVEDVKGRGGSSYVLAGVKTLFE